MYRYTFLWSAALVTLVASTNPFAAGDDAPLRYPETRKIDQVDTLFGVEIADPYRWLEDLDAPETAAWVAAQNEVTFGFLAGTPGRDTLGARITALIDYERYGLPSKEGGRYFYSRNDGLQPQSVIYVADRLDAEPRVLLDPNKLSADGTIAVRGTFVSDDGQWLAYTLTSGGSDWNEIRVRNVETGEDSEDHIRWVKFSGASWTRDNAGFYYTRYDEPTGNKLEQVNRFPKLMYHRLGTAQSEDRLVYERPDQPDWGIGGGVTEDGRYLIIYLSEGTKRENRIYYQELTSESPRTVPLLDEADAQYSFVGNDGPRFWFFTNLEAPRGRLVEIDIRQPERVNWKELIAEAADTLQGVSAVGGHFVAEYLQDAKSRVVVFDRTGQRVRDVDLPTLGTTGGFGGKWDDAETFFVFTSFVVPPRIYRYDVTTGERTLFREPKVAFDPERYETKQVFYPSKDGTRVPMFITHRKGLVLDGQQPTLLYGYGGFNAAMTPSFSVSRVVWLELGGVYVLANIRGGGEYGREWHDGGKLENKQNCFDDFHAAAEWLIANQYTRPARLAIEGGSNGGLLVAACILQRPDLYGAGVAAVGVLDMLRFHKFTIGWAWKSDYGDPDVEADFRTLLKYSPLHNIKTGTCYPALLATTGDHDDRVVPSHSFKFIAALQAAQGCANPVLIRVETRAGHGAGKPTQKIIEEMADKYAFLMRVLGMTLPTGEPR
ncbi:MAG: S9 family peptidase [Phycisphaerales bacterium]|nr:S9 family peptidase [Phycisphaerales bacterium]